MDEYTLLKKYMDYVGTQEGTNFIDSVVTAGHWFFTDEENTILVKLNQELSREYLEKKYGG